MRDLLSGENLRLTSMKENDLFSIEEWFNDVGFLRHYDILPALPKSRAQLEDLIKSYQNSDERCIYAIREKHTGKIVGVAGFDEIIWTSSVATIFIGIGNKTYRGKGFGKEALRLLLDFGFNELNFHRIHLNVISYNLNAIRLYEGLGFVKEGVYRELVYRDGKRYDLYLYGLLKSEWDNTSK